MKPIIDKIKKISVVSSIDLPSINFISPKGKKYCSESSQSHSGKTQVAIEKTADDDHDQNTFTDIIQILGRVFFLLRIHAFNINLCLAAFNIRMKSIENWEKTLLKKQSLTHHMEA